MSHAPVTLIIQDCLVSWLHEGLVNRITELYCSRQKTCGSLQLLAD